jgi:hypothetical protein
MKRVTLVLALAALSVPAAAGAAQTSSQPAAPSKAIASHVKIYGTVNAITRSTVKVANATRSRTFARGAVSLTGVQIGARVEAEGFVRRGVLRLSAIHVDDRAAQNVSSTPSANAQPGDDRGGQTVSTTPSSDDQPGDDHGGQTVSPTQGDDDLGGRHGGQDDAPGHL